MKKIFQTNETRNQLGAWNLTSDKISKLMRRKVLKSTTYLLRNDPSMLDCYTMIHWAWQCHLVMSWFSVPSLHCIVISQWSILPSQCWTVQSQRSVLPSQYYILSNNTPWSNRILYCVIISLAIYLGVGFLHQMAASLLFCVCFFKDSHIVLHSHSNSHFHQVCKDSIFFTPLPVLAICSSVWHKECVEMELLRFA